MACYYFPPLVGIAAERARAFTRHLPSLGWEPTVVVPRAGHYHTGPATDDLSDIRVVPTFNPELSRLFRSTYADVTGGALGDERTVRPVSTGRVGDRLRRWVREYLYVPDAQVGWIPFAARAAARCVRVRAGRTVLYSSSVPFSAHVAAAWASRSTGAPWVAEFRDPWTAHEPSFRHESRLRNAVDERIESWLLGVAAHVVVTAESTRERMLAHFPRLLSPDKVTVIPNGFEEVQGLSRPEAGQCMTLVHAGTLQRAEEAVPLLGACARLWEREPGSIRLDVYGMRDPWLEAGGWGEALPPWLALHGLVTPREAREAMAGASVLVLLLPQTRFRRIISGKLMEYLGARRPILAHIPRPSEMEDLITRHGDGRLLSGGDAPEIEGVLGGLLEEHRAGTLQADRVDVALVRPLSRRAQTERLVRILEEVVKR